MGKRFAITLLALALAALWAGPVGAQEAYPPPEDTDVLDVVDVEEPAAETADDVEVEGVALEQDRGALPVTGATLAALTAVGVGVLALGATMLVVSRRRVHVR